MEFLLNSQAHGVFGKNERKVYLAKGPAGPPEARGPMQLHRLHRLKAGHASYWVPRVLEHWSKNTSLILIKKLNPYGLDIRNVLGKCCVYWMFCIYLVFVVVAFFLKHQFTINEYFSLLPWLIF